MIFTALDTADDDLALWSQHLDQTESRYTIIENQLTRFMLVHICGHYEMEIKGIILKRVQKSGDPGVTSYVKFLLERRAPVHPDALKGVLKKFGGECLSRFTQNTSEADLNQYANIVVNRNKSAHGEQIQTSFDEICAYHAGAKRVIVAFDRALEH